MNKLDSLLAPAWKDFIALTSLANAMNGDVLA